MWHGLGVYLFEHVVVIGVLKDLLTCVGIVVTGWLGIRAVLKFRVQALQARKIEVAEAILREMSQLVVRIRMIALGREKVFTDGNATMLNMLDQMFFLRPRAQLVFAEPVPSILKAFSDAAVAAVGSDPTESNEARVKTFGKAWMRLQGQLVVLFQDELGHASGGKAKQIRLAWAASGGRDPEAPPKAQRPSIGPGTASTPDPDDED